MTMRSRGGCIDCKKAKVKCDEVHPGCGTCYRRGYICRGYVKTELKAQPISSHAPAPPQVPTSTVYNTPDLSEINVGNEISAVMQHDVESPASLVVWNCTTSNTLVSRSNATDEDERQIQPPLYLNSISHLPPGTISSYDGSVIEIYFTRHPAELVISPEFVEEMNSNILQVFYNDPQAVCDALSAIGHIYLGLNSTSSLVPVLDRKARILARLRKMNGVGQDLEKTMVLLLGLCALELIDGKSSPGDTDLPALIANTAFNISYHVSEGRVLTSVAKYFIRALARQDIIIALTYSRRSLIAVDSWLDEECAKQPDRFMGYTGTMMPILADLCALAEDIQIESSSEQALPAPSTDEDSQDTTIACFPSGNSIYKRAQELRHRIKEWRPIAKPKFSFQSSKIFLFHARSFQAAALLYLHRLLYPPGSSDSADETGVSMAHDVLMYISGTPSELKMSLWPVFIAATELLSDEDRGTVLQAYDMIYTQRGTVTSRRAKNFTVERVWKARDAGLDWNWRVLAYQYPGECMPI